jgi:hypothetical protein
MHISMSASRCSKEDHELRHRWFPADDLIQVDTTVGTAHCAAGVDSLYEAITRRNRKPVIQPKDLYRKLAMLLAEIDEGRDKEDYLLSVLATLNNSFIRDLHITDGRLYAEDEEQFLPMNVGDGGKRVRVAPSAHWTAKRPGWWLRMERTSITIRR